MAYKLIGMLVWKCMKYALRQKYGAAMVPKPLLAGGLVLAILGGVRATLQRSDG